MIRPPARDASGNGHTGTYQSDALGVAGLVPGDGDYAAQFASATDDYVSGDGVVASGTTFSAVTMGCIVRPVQGLPLSTFNVPLFSLYDSALEAPCMTIRQGTGGALLFVVGGSGSSGVAVSATVMSDAGTYRFVD